MPVESYGSDPEFMLVDQKQQYVSAIPVVPGTSEERYEKNGHGFYWDNVLAECSIKPGFNKEEAVENFQSCFRTYAEIVRPFRLVPQASQDYPESELQDKRARIAGCAQDYCVYTGKRKKPPKQIIEKTSLRTGGGHIHLGQGSGVLHDDTWESWIVVYLLDLFVGIPSLFMDHDPTSGRRRVVYGQAGRYRPKNYGMEYRSLGNFWLSSPKTVKLIFDMCDFVVKFVEDEKWQDLWSFDEELYYSTVQITKAYKCKAYDVKTLRRALDECDLETAKQFLPLLEKFYPRKMWTRIEKHFVNTQYDFYKEWGIATF